MSFSPGCYVLAGLLNEQRVQLIAVGEMACVRIGASKSYKAPERELDIFSEERAATAEKVG